MIAPIIARPQAVLFACGLNSVRSPMAAALFKHLFGHVAYVGSAGVRTAELDPFAVAAMDEVGFDLIVTLSPEAHHKALDLTRTLAADVEYWPTPDPTDTEGSREQRLDAYRAVRDMLLARIKDRFGPPPGAMAGM